MKYSIGGEDLLKIIQRASSSSENPINADLIAPDDLDNIQAPFTNPQRRPYLDIFNRVFIERTDSNVSSQIGEVDDTTAANTVQGRTDNNPKGRDIKAAQQSQLPNLSNRILINYKNHVIKEKVQGTNEVLFYNKIVETNQGDLSNEKWFNPSINNIVEQLGQAQTDARSSRTNISYSDFLYCKKLGAYPNNRLVILRRFAEPVHDDLLEYPFSPDSAPSNQLPMSVMVTWFDEFPVKISFQDKFEKYEKGGLFAAIGEAINGLSLGDPKEKKFDRSGIRSRIDGLTGSPWLNAFWFQAINQVYQETGIEPNSEFVLPQPANPNFIREAVIKTGITSNISADLTFTYVMRQIGNVDPHVAMHALIANSIRMGTSTSINLFPTEVGDRGQLSDTVTLFAQGKIQELIRSVITNLSSIINSISSPQDDQSTVTNTTGNQSDVSAIKNQGDDSVDLLSFAGDSLRLILSVYRFRIMAALSADTGLPSGHWHLTVGNPFNPIISVGDLTLAGDVDIAFNNELSYQDFPTELSVNVKLVSARSRGAQEIERIFNSGRGRIYVYPRDADNPDLFLSDENIYRGDPIPNNRELGVGADQAGETFKNLFNGN